MILKGQLKAIAGNWDRLIDVPSEIFKICLSSAYLDISPTKWAYYLIMRISVDCWKNQQISLLRYTLMIIYLKHCHCYVVGMTVANHNRINWFFQLSIDTIVSMYDKSYIELINWENMSIELIIT